MKSGEYCEWDKYRDESTGVQKILRAAEVSIFEHVRWSLFRATRLEARSTNLPANLSGLVLRSMYRKLSDHMSLEIDENEAVWHGISELVPESTITQVRSEVLSPEGTLVGDFQRNVLLAANKTS